MRGPGGDKVLSNEPGLDRALQSLNQALKGEISKGSVEVSLQQRGLVISLKQATFFPSGEDVIASEAYSSVERVARVIRGLPNPVRLEGHTDSVPISNSRFRNNWVLSAARAIAVLDLLSGTLDVARARLAVVGYAETVPIDTNETAAGRARNRRGAVLLRPASWARRHALS